MGLWSFMKDSGKKLFGGDEEPTAEALEKEVADLGLDTEGSRYFGRGRQGQSRRYGSEPGDP